jgi:hypothetical protein
MNMTTLKSRWALLCFFAMALLAGSGQAATWLVPGDVLTIQEGIDAAAVGDTVLVSCGTYLEHDIIMKGGIYLIGESEEPGCVVIDAEGQGRVMDCLNLTETPHISNMTFTGGLVAEGWFEALGGGVRSQLSSVSFSHCIFEGNTARIGAGLGASESTLTLVDCTFTLNAAEHFEWAAGGAIWARDSQGTIDNCLVTANTAFSTNLDDPGDGGGFFFNNCRLDVTHSNFEDNSTGAGAGAFYSVTTDSSSFSFCEFIDNTAANGGAVYFEYGAAAQLSNCTFRGNVATAGGAIVIFNESYPLLRECLFENNQATVWGGGAIDCWSSNVEIDSCIFRNNSANTNGGGANFGGSQATIAGSMFTGNSANNKGGAIRCHFADVTTTECTMVGNEAVTGGGIHCGDLSTANVNNTLIAFSTGGGAMAGFEPDFATISCSDFYGNDGGDWTGDFAPQLGINGNFSADPVFCESSVGDYALDHISPCAAENQLDCGQVGARGIGCYLSATPLVNTLPSPISQVGNYPNPFNPSTTIFFTLAEAGTTRVQIYDLAGHVVRHLADGEFPGQAHRLNWDGRSDAGRPVPTGVYFYRITSGTTQVSGRMALVK